LCIGIGKIAPSGAADQMNVFAGFKNPEASFKGYISYNFSDFHNIIVLLGNGILSRKNFVLQQFEKYLGPFLKLFC
jgi:hypothetical protein